MFAREWRNTKGERRKKIEEKEMIINKDKITKIKEITFVKRNYDAESGCFLFRKNSFARAAL